MQLEYCERQLCCNNYSNSEKICSTMQFVLKKVTCGFFLWRKLLESTVEGENWASHSEENDLEFEFWDLKNEKILNQLFIIVIVIITTIIIIWRKEMVFIQACFCELKISWLNTSTQIQFSFSAILRHLSLVYLSFFFSGGDQFRFSSLVIERFVGFGQTKYTWI